MSDTATLTHPGRAIMREDPPLLRADVDRAVEQLAATMARASGDRGEAHREVVRAAGRLVRAWRRGAALDDDRPLPAAGSWSLDNGMVDAGLG